MYVQVISKENLSTYLSFQCNFAILLIAIYSIYKASRHKKDHQGMTNVKMAKLVMTI